MENVQENNILEFLNHKLISINFNCQNFTQAQVIASQHIDQAHLGINQFVAELREEELGVLFSHLMKVFADFSIETNTCVIVNCELLLISILALNAHSPSVQKLNLAQIIILFK
jgi:hypothetical protein